MIKLARVGLFVVITCFGLLASCSSDKKPSNDQLREALVQKLPDYVKVTDFGVEAMENTGNEVEPNYVSRFRAEIEVTSPLYTRDGKEGNLIFLQAASETGSQAEIFGNSSSVLFQGGWEHGLFIDGNTVSELGRPLNEFSRFETIIRGSAEETVHYDALKAANAEFEATVVDLPLHELVKEYYDTSSEWAGKFEIHEVLASRSEKSTNEQFVVHAKYSYRKPAAGEPSGEDRRTFTFRKLDNKWQIFAMGFAGSGRIE